MMDLEEVVKNQINELFSKYGISSIEKAKEICDEKKIDVEGIVKKNENIPDNAVWAFILGTAIAIKKQTKLASYVALDIGESIQAFCNPNVGGFLQNAGNAFADMVSSSIREKTDKTQGETSDDYVKALDFLGMTKDELARTITTLSEEVEKVMSEE